MKKLFLSLIAVAAMAMAFTKVNERNHAKVEKYFGMDVYIYSEPLAKYEVLEEKSLNVAMGCKEWIIAPIRKAGKVQGAEGVIIDFPEPGKMQGINYKVIRYLD